MKFINMFCHKRTLVSFEMFHTMAQIIKQWAVCNFTIFTYAFVSMLCGMVTYQITCILCHSTVKNRFIWGIFVSLVFSTLSSKNTNYLSFYTPAPRMGRGVYCFTSVRLSFRPSKIFFSVTVDGRNLIYGHKRHICIPYCG